MESASMTLTNWQGTHEPGKEKTKRTKREINNFLDKLVKY
jgi:hypothetical protein